MYSFTQSCFYAVHCIIMGSQSCNRLLLTSFVRRSGVIRQNEPSGITLDNSERGYNGDGTDTVFTTDRDKW